MTTGPNLKEKKTAKFFLNTFLILGSAIYAGTQYFGAPSTQKYVNNLTPDQTLVENAGPTNTTTQTPVQTTPPPKKTKPKPTPAPVSTPVVVAPPPKKTGQYTDGIYTGNMADAYYGMVQVQATVSGGALTDVQFLSYPSDRSTSRYINGQAMPFLKTEAIQAQSGNVDIVSGATDTSLAFRESLTNALAQAK